MLTLLAGVMPGSRLEQPAWNSMGPTFGKLLVPATQQHVVQEWVMCLNYMSEVAKDARASMPQCWSKGHHVRDIILSQP